MNESEKRAMYKYASRKIKQYNIRLNKDSDVDIIEKLSAVENINEYIKTLIRNDIKNPEK